jgi:hypothetical protein
MNLEANKGKDIVYDQIASFANQNKLLSSGKKIFADIAKTSKLIQINFNSLDMVRLAMRGSGLNNSISMEFVSMRFLQFSSWIIRASMANGSPMKSAAMETWKQLLL